jgi:SAM-dependent methyltransferase
VTPLQHTTDLFQALSDPSRLRMLAVLAVHELSVAELVESLHLVQSRVSAHLSRLKEAGLLRAVKDGAATRWTLDPAALDEAGQRIWAAAAPELGSAHFAKDVERAAAVVARRAAPRGSWPETVAGEMEKHYSPGRTWESMARAIATLLELGDVLDVGAGDGTVAALLAPFARTYTCIDASERMVAAARARLRGVPNASVTVARIEALPFEGASFDRVLLLNVLTCIERPEEALAEAARVLRPGGQLLVVTLDRHEHLDVAARYGHVVPGIAPARLKALIERTGLSVRRATVTSHERREPRFGVVTATADLPLGATVADGSPAPVRARPSKRPSRDRAPSSRQERS